MTIQSLHMMILVCMAALWGLHGGIGLCGRACRLYGGTMKLAWCMVELEWWCHVWWSSNGEIGLYCGLHGGAMSWWSLNGEIGLY